MLSSSSFFRSLIHGGFLTLYSSFWTILILHLFIIWAPTWVSIPSDTLFGFLWVMIAKIALFKGFLNINAARKAAAMHSMQWQQLYLKYFLVPILLVCLWCSPPVVEFLGMLLWVARYVLDLHLAYPRRYSSSKHLSQPFHWNITLVDSELNTPTIVYSSFDQSMSSNKPQGPIYNFGPLSL